MSKKDYEQFAALLKRARPEARDDLAGWTVWRRMRDGMVSIFLKDNPRFDMDIFYGATGGIES